jgi:hypothetical protein
MINNHSYRILDVFDVMSSLCADFYNVEHFLIIYFIISLCENHLFEVKNDRTSLIIDFYELRKNINDDKIECINFHHRLVIEFVMSQHRCVYEDSFDWFHEFFYVKNHDELDFELILVVFFQQRKKLNIDFKKCVNETFIKICKIDENLHIFMRFRFRSILDDDNSVCLHRYLIEAHSKIKKIHMKNMKTAFIELEIKIKFF